MAHGDPHGRAEGWRPRGLSLPETLDYFTDKGETPNDCWAWSGNCDPDGYARIYWGGRTRKALRLAYQEAHGAIPEGLVVRHACDNPPCLNPRHLLVGTVAENNQDKAVRGWWHDSPAPKLTSADKRRIRELHGQGFSTVNLGAMFGVTRQAIAYTLKAQKGGEGHPKSCASKA